MIRRLPDGTIKITLPPDHELITALKDWKARGAPVQIEIEDEFYDLVPVEGHATRYWVVATKP